MACDALAQVHMSWSERKDYENDEDFNTFKAACSPTWHMTDMLWDLLAYVHQSPKPTCDLRK